MQARTCLALLVALPAIALAEDLGCGGDDELARTYVEVWQAADLRQQELLESAQRAWQEYRDANCELISERDRNDLKDDALATCLEFMDRERQFELRLISRFIGGH